MQTESYSIFSAGANVDDMTAKVSTIEWWRQPINHHDPESQYLGNKFGFFVQTRVYHNSKSEKPSSKEITGDDSTSAIALYF